VLDHLADSLGETAESSGGRSGPEPRMHFDLAERTSRRTGDCGGEAQAAFVLCAAPGQVADAPKATVAGRAHLRTGRVTRVDACGRLVVQGTPHSERSVEMRAERVSARLVRPMLPIADCSSEPDLVDFEPEHARAAAGRLNPRCHWVQPRSGATDGGLAAPSTAPTGSSSLPVVDGVGQQLCVDVFGLRTAARATGESDQVVVEPRRPWAADHAEVVCRSACVSPKAGSRHESWLGLR
jgi:hypothetical protein